MRKEPDSRINLILTIGILLFGFAFVSALVVPNLPYKAAYSGKPLDAKGRECNHCRNMIEKDVLNCPHCGN